MRQTVHTKSHTGEQYPADILAHPAPKKLILLNFALFGSLFQTLLVRKCVSRHFIIEGSTIMLKHCCSMVFIRPRLSLKRLRHHNSISTQKSRSHRSTAYPISRAQLKARLYASGERKKQSALKFRSSYFQNRRAVIFSLGFLLLYCTKTTYYPKNTNQFPPLFVKK